MAQDEIQILKILFRLLKENKKAYIKYYVYLQTLMQRQQLFGGLSDSLEFNGEQKYESIKELINIAKTCSQTTYQGYSLINWSFTWDTTDEGNEFWCALHKKMLSIKNVINLAKLGT